MIRRTGNNEVGDAYGLSHIAGIVRATGTGRCELTISSGDGDGRVRSDARQHVAGGAACGRSLTRIGSALPYAGDCNRRSMQIDSYDLSCLGADIASFVNGA